MELELGLNFLLQSLPAIAQIFSSIQEEKISHLKHKQALELHKVHTTRGANRQEENEFLWGGTESEKLRQQSKNVADLALKDKKNKLQLVEAEKIIENWPLRLLPSQILASHSQGNTRPLRIFLLPLQVTAKQPDHLAQFLPEIDSILAQSLSEFLNENYSLNDSERPTEFLSSVWKKKNFHRETSIKTLFESFKSEPTLILESEIVGDTFSFRIAYWGFGQKSYSYKTIICRLNYRLLLEESAINRALKWKKTAQKLLECGETPEDIQQLGGDNAFNLQLLEKIQRWQSHGIDTSQLSVEYKLNRQDFEELCQFLITCHCLVSGWIADAHHLIHYNVLPRLPELISDLTQTTYQQEIVQEAIQTTLQQLEAEHSLVHPPKSAPLILHPESKSTLHALALNHTLTGHSGKSASIAISRDGQTIASATEDNNIKIWDLKSGELLNTFQSNTGRILTIAMSPDGQTLASSHRTSERSSINVWDLRTGELLHTLNGHKKWIYTLAISPDGNTLASGGYKIKIWNLKTGELQHTLTGHDKWIYSLTISPDGTTLVSSGGDKTIKIWQLETGELKRVLTGHSDWVRTLAISPNGEILASGGDDNTINLWQLGTGKKLHTLRGHSDWVLSLAISPDGETVISGSRDHSIKIWHLNSGKLLSTLTGHKKWVYSLAISPDGKTLASGSDDKTIKIWQAV